ncbi:efflux RND transporter periplasmic adaptor subunit [Roseospirillum parvum]|uniref:Membrane fusion protein, macrolide-specific efflux system n=1 Tax=Roseospirillum parvum TaxID=83401 RepID=A0A1G8AP76_9PROT|nr:efflux RND transporter periplasmic adaptor subunit [Roseospirillum parvum]SDH22801.1 membrane fusion protein, macrolide-specific efflux system [Roseospirillum parvum]
MAWRRLAVVIVVGSGLALGGAWLGRGLFAPEPVAPPASAVAGLGTIEDTVLANGTLKASRLVSVGAQVSGQIETLAVALGDQVEAGQLIAGIESESQENALRDAEAELAYIKAQRQSKVATLKQARLAFERQQRLLAQDATPREDYEAAEATLATTQADIAALDAQIAQAVIAVDRARTDLGYTRIVAPMAGTVVAVVVEAGQTVNANQTTPTIVKIARLDPMTVEAEISEADVVRVRPGLEAYFTILGDPDTRYPATLRAIEPAPTSIEGDDDASTDDSAIYYNGLLDVANPDHRLRIDMTAQVSIVLARAEAAVLVPASALLHDGGQPLVKVLGADGSIAARSVEVGINTNIRAQITDGLSPGERVVLSPAEVAETDRRRRGPPSPLGF